MKELKDICHIPVKFSEIDSMQRVWHGTYITYFEDGRESFGRHYPGISYADMQQSGIYAPIYDLQARYYAPLAMNDTAIIHTSYIYKPGARLDYTYKIYRESDNTLCAEGSTTQLFIDTQGELMTDKPGYYQQWQDKYQITNLKINPMNENIKSTYKSNDTEEWLDKVWTRPIGYQWALLFKWLNIHPNTVTILSMILGASSALFFAHGSWRTEGINGLLYNLIAILLLSWANFYDSADGQLARMTGQKTQLGRILDGAASEVWFIPIYLSLVYRFYHHHTLEFRLLHIPDNEQNTWIATLIYLGIVLYAGFGCHSRQCGLADYYRQIHLYFLKGETGSELDNSTQQQKIYNETPWKGNFLWKIFLKTYINYTKTQETQTPHFQQLLKKLQEKYGSTTHISQTFRDNFRTQSLPLMKWTNILTFNTRAILLYTTCLFDLPWLYFVFEIAMMTTIYYYMRHHHEQICKKLFNKL